jgi:hypothetical protein
MKESLGSQNASLIMTSRKRLVRPGDREQRREFELLEQLFKSSHPEVWFAPPARSMLGYQEFTTGTVWPLQRLTYRGWVEITERVPAGPREEQWWDGVAATLTALGREKYTELMGPQGVKGNRAG